MIYSPMQMLSHRPAPAVDPLERQAEQAADQVLAGDQAMQPFNSSTPQVQTKSQKESSPQTGTGGTALPKGGGKALEDTTLQQMNRSFASDFSQVRIHTDERAIQMSQNLQAHAFTYGSDIYFNAGEYQPHSSEGKHLLAHELTHVLQQNRGGASSNPMIQKASKKNCEAISAYPELTMPAVVAAINQAWDASRKNDRFSTEDLESYNQRGEAQLDECLDRENGSLRDCDFKHESLDGRESHIGSKYRESGFNVFADGSVSEITSAELPWKVTINVAADAIAVFHTHPPMQRTHEGGVSPEDAAALSKFGASKRLYVINRDNVELIGGDILNPQLIARFRRKDLGKCL